MNPRTRVYMQGAAEMTSLHSDSSTLFGGFSEVQVGVHHDDVESFDEVWMKAPVEAELVMRRSDAWFAYFDVRVGTVVVTHYTPAVFKSKHELVQALRGGHVVAGGDPVG